jgi:FKBP-type peptidyl-prolyl cis-trans isomerase SlyD
MTIKKHSVVAIDYELKDPQGGVLDRSDGEPLVYLHGAGNIIIGLEEQLEGKAVGDQVNAVVEPEKGYGQPIDALIQTVPKAAFGGVDNIEVGMRFQAETERGAVPVQVTKIEDDMVTVDGNHPLAGQQLHFDVTVRDIREASEEEIEHGHAHGPGGHQH